jgi:hypothetical protein
LDCLPHICGRHGQPLRSIRSTLTSRAAFSVYRLHWPLSPPCDGPRAASNGRGPNSDPSLPQPLEGSASAPAPLSRTTCRAGSEPWVPYIWNTIWGRHPKYRHDPKPFNSAFRLTNRLYQPSVPTDPASDLLRILVGAYCGDTIAASSGGSLLGPVAQIADRTWASGVSGSSRPRSRGRLVHPL